MSLTGLLSSTSDVHYDTSPPPGSTWSHASLGRWKGIPDRGTRHWPERASVMNILTVFCAGRWKTSTLQASFTFFQDCFYGRVSNLTASRAMGNRITVESDDEKEHKDKSLVERRSVPTWQKTEVFATVTFHFPPSLLRSFHSLRSSSSLLSSPVPWQPHLSSTISIPIRSRMILDSAAKIPPKSIRARTKLHFEKDVRTDFLLESELISLAFATGIIDAASFA